MTNQIPPAYMTKPSIPEVTSTKTTKMFDNAYRKNSHYASVRTTAIIHLTGGSLLVLLGIVAIILLAFWSYFATPIWAGIVIYILTGLLGLLASSRGDRCSTIAYISMSVLAALMSISLTFMYSFAAANEFYYCQPGRYYVYCYTSEAAREAFDALIVITAFFELIVSIMSAYYGCRLVCRWDEICCGDFDDCCLSSTTAVFMTNGSVVPTTGPGFTQCGNVVLKGGMPYPSQPPVYIVQQGPTAANPNGAPLQYGAGTAPSYAYVNPALQQSVPYQQLIEVLPEVEKNKK